MAKLPEDIIDRLIQMERRIQALSTAVNTRPPINEIRPDATQPTPSRPVFRVYDGYNHEIFADDIATGGLARPWLPLLPPQNLAVATWPSTTATGWTTIARSINPIWQPRMRLYLYTKASAGATGQVRVLVDGAQFGQTVLAPNSFDHTGPVTSDMQGRFGQNMTVEIQAMVTSTSGTVYAQPLMMHGFQS